MLLAECDLEWETELAECDLADPERDLEKELEEPEREPERDLERLDPLELALCAFGFGLRTNKIIRVSKGQVGKESTDVERVRDREGKEGTDVERVSKRQRGKGGHR